MPEAFIDGEIETVDTLWDVLPRELPKDTRIALDTETSGLFIDGNWVANKISDTSPPGRVSIVSMAWREDDGWLREVAIPFDQGKIGGKPGVPVGVKTGDERPFHFEPLAHTPKCLETCGVFVAEIIEPVSMTGCVCAPHNLGPTDWRQLMIWLANRPLVMHHSKFDCHMVRVGLRDLKDYRAYNSTYEGQGEDLMDQVVWDTQTVQGIIAPLESSGLKPTMSRLFGEHEGDEKKKVEAALRKNGVGLTKRYDLLDWRIIAPYASKDASQTLRLAERQWTLVEEGHIDPKMVKTIQDEYALTRVLYGMECRGIPYDAAGLREEQQKIRAEVEVGWKNLPFTNINEAKNYFFTLKEIEPPKRTDTGAPSLDQESVGILVDQGVKYAKEYQRVAQLESLLSKWYVSWPNKIGVDGRLRTNFRQGRIESDRKGAKSGGAISGRLSAERIQAQGVPREFTLPKDVRHLKSFFRAPNWEGDWWYKSQLIGLGDGLGALDEWELWELDQSNAEVRVAAWLSQCEALAAVVNSGRNIHDENTANLFGYTRAMVASGDITQAEYDDWRTIAKTTIFGDLYGAGVSTLQAQIEQATKGKKFPESKVREFKAALNAAYPELKVTAQAVQRKADVGMGGCGHVNLVNGRRRTFGWGERTHKAFNACIQGGVAEIMKYWMVDVDRQYPGFLVNQVHDSLWIQVTRFHAQSTISHIQRMGEELFSKWFSTPELPIKFKVDAKRIWPKESV